MLNIVELKTRIGHIHAYAENLKSFLLRPEGGSLPFAPGQFVMATLPGLVDRNGRKIAKAYSIASSPLDKDIELCISRFPNGALSTPLFKAAVGDEVIITGPYGFFALKMPVPSGTVFMAGGTGIAPLMSMLRFLYSRGCNEPLWLFYSMSEPNLFLYKEELLGYQGSNNLRLVASTSNPDSAWPWERGRVTDTFQKKAAEISQGTQFYICGPPLMVADTVKMLEQLGYRKENIHREQW